MLARKFTPKTIIGTAEINLLENINSSLPDDYRRVKQ